MVVPCATFVLSVSSPSALFATPEFPFNAPQRLRETTRAQKERDMPTRIMESVIPKRPTRRTGLRPMRSERRDQ
jgi:hypothetical protein